YQPFAIFGLAGAQFDHSKIECRYPPIVQSRTALQAISQKRLSLRIIALLHQKRAECSFQRQCSRRDFQTRASEPFRVLQELRSRLIKNETRSSIDELEFLFLRNAALSVLVANRLRLVSLLQTEMALHFHQQQMVVRFRILID